ncbi:tetratricopeptide repeat protein [Amycolatopsis thailandensis]|nr:tetratricopeptide repeat protein [Amycolatopsis thailandensis]
MLALLLLHAGRPVLRETILRRVWPDEVPTPNSISGYVTDLRAIVTGACGGAARMPRRVGAWLLQIDEQVEFDLREFTEGLHAAQTAARDRLHDQVISETHRALGQWSGIPLDGLTGGWVSGEREVLEEKHHAVWRLLLEAELALGRNLEVLDKIGKPLSTWPADQTLIHHHLLALYRAGRRSEALAEYQVIHRRLDEIDGIGPGRMLQELHAAILREDTALKTPAGTAVVNGEHQLVPPSALDGLPLRSVFVGRDSELAQLADALQPGHEQSLVVVSAVAGQGGIGKTALAIQAAHDARDAGWFPGGVLFADLRGYDPDHHPVPPTEILGSWLRDLGIADEHIPADLPGRETLFRTELASRAREGQRLLVVADNAADSAQVRSLQPGGGVHRMLVTSRNTLADLDARLIDLAVLTPDEALALLEEMLRVAHPDDDRVARDADQASQLVKLCGYLPLALRITAARLAADPKQPLAEEVGLLADETTRLETLDYVGSLDIRVSFSLSYRTLTSAQARLYRLLSINPGQQISVDAAAALADLPVRQTRRVLNDLQRAHLIDFGQPRGWWRLHDLMRLFAHEHFQQTDPDADRDEAIERLLNYYLTVTADAGQHLNARIALQNRSNRFSTRQSALRWLDIERPTLIATVRFAAETGHQTHARDLSFRLTDYFYLKKHLDDWVGTHLLALDAARQLNDRNGEGKSLNNLGVAYWELRRFDDAITCYKKALDIRRKVNDRHGEGQILNNLGIVYKELRQFDDAITCYEQDIEISREADDRFGEGQTLGNLGNVYRQLRRFDDAVTCYEQALDARREINDRHGEGAMLDNLGIIYNELQRFDDAITCHKQALDIRREIDDRHGEGRTLNNLGGVYRELQQFDDAVTFYEQALDIRREINDRHGESQTLNNLGKIHRELGQFDDAIIHHKQALDIRREVNDPHAEGATLGDMGRAYRSLDRIDDARRSWVQALELLAVFSDPSAQRTAANIRSWLSDVDENS